CGWRIDASSRAARRPRRRCRLGGAEADLDDEAGAVVLAVQANEVVERPAVQACIRAPLVILSTIFLSSRNASPTTFMVCGEYCLTVARFAASCVVENMSGI